MRVPGSGLRDELGLREPESSAVSSGDIARVHFALALRTRECRIERDQNAVPYFLWDDHTTVAEAKAILAGSDAPARDELVARILREANTRDVWVFLDWKVIDEVWPRIERRVGRSRGMWTLLRSRHLENARAQAA